MKTEEEVPSCDWCSAHEHLYPAGDRWMLCEKDWQDWFTDEPAKPVEEQSDIEHAAERFVLFCTCGEIVKGTEAEAQCACGRVWTVFQIF